MHRSTVVSLLLPVALVACVPALRDEPTLREKCEALREYCADLPAARGDLAECYEVGRRGVREPANRDQCFVAWDECIDECEYLTSRGGTAQMGDQADAGQ